MEPTVSVITPFSRGVKELSTLLRDFKNQTFKFFEHIIVFDGEPSVAVKSYMEYHCPPYTRFVFIVKDQGNMSVAPGTNPRNYGVSVSRGKYVVFADDDDRYKSTFLKSLIVGMQEGSINVVQMSCSEARIKRDGDPTRVRLVPEIGLPLFPMICHVGTPCFIIPKEWAEKEPWRDESEHDFKFIKRICDKFKPKVRIIGGMQVDVDGLVIKNMVDWVAHPPFFRGD